MKDMRKQQDENLPQLVLGEDYYMEHGLMVMTPSYLKKRGYCCGSGCRYCPFAPRHQAGTKTISGDSRFLEENKTCSKHQSET